MGRARALAAAFRSCGGKHVGLALSVVLYGLLGGALFQAIEQQNELHQRTATARLLESDAVALASEILRLADNGTVNATEQAIALVKQYQTLKGLHPSEAANWDFAGGVYYAGTLFTTIGYGHYACGTRAGQAATMLYSLIGVPLMLALLSDLGQLLGKLVRRAYASGRRASRRLCCRREGAEAAAEEEAWVSSAEAEVPLALALGLVVGWILVCSAVFHVWETEWDYFTAFYFFFISLTTIGLGDVNPSYPKYMTFACGFVIIGLALISMLMNVIQQKLERLHSQTFDGEGEANEEKQGGRTSIGVFQVGRKSRASVAPVKVAEEATGRSPGAESKAVQVTLSLVESLHWRVRRDESARDCFKPQDAQDPVPGDIPAEPRDQPRLHCRPTPVNV